MRDFIQDGNVFRVHPAPMLSSLPPPAPPPPTASSHQHSATLADSQHNSSSAEFLNFIGRRNNHISDAAAPTSISIKPNNNNRSARLSAATICQRSCSYLDQIFDQQTAPQRDSLDLDSSSSADTIMPTKRIIYSRSERHKSCMLWVVTPLLASLAVAIVIASLAGPQWLLTEERLPNPLFNGTANLHRPDDGYYLVKHTRSSLWILCSSQGDTFLSCTTIDYFPQEEYSPDPNDSTMAIPYAITRSTPFFLLSGIALLVSYLVLVVAMCSPQQRNVYFFTSGILFIISGLVMLIGLIMYISIFKAEIGSKMRPKSPLQPPLFTFTYGQSFLLYVIGFVLTEIVGVLNVYLFIGLQQVHIKDGRVGETNESTSEIMNVMGKHPMLPAGYYSPMTQRRYYFEKLHNNELQHHRGQSANHRASSLDNRFKDNLPGANPLKYSPYDVKNSAGQQFPLTRSVSTATELFEYHNKPNNNYQDDPLAGRTNRYGTLRSSSTHHLDHHTNATHFHHQSMMMGRAGSTSSIRGSTNYQAINKRTKTKDELFSEFCERAGRRYNAPKEIYFIDANDEDIHHHGYDDRQQQRATDYEQIMQKARRSSVMGPPTGSAMRNSNLYASNSSLHKSYPKNLFDLEQQRSGAGQCHNKLGHSQKNSQHSPSNRSMDSRHWRESHNEYSSQTLPRDFLKRNVEFDQLNGNARLSEENHQQYNNNNHSNNEGQRATIEDIGRSYRIKSQENLLSTQRPQRASHSSQDDIVNWPNAIPASPSGYSREQFHIRPGHLYGVGAAGIQATTPTHSFYHNTDGGGYEHDSNSGGGGGGCRREAPMGQHHQQQQQARQSPDGDFGTFDLDRIETERRKSHASLFESAIDFENGTAV